MADDERRAEIEAAIEAAMPEMENRFMWAASTGNHPDATAEGAVRTILEPLLDRVRDARDDEAGQRFWCPDCGASEIHHDWCEAFPGEPVVHGNREAPTVRSPQGEDHEAEIPEAALDAAEQAVHACRHYALGHPSRRALYVDARDEAYDVLAAALPHLAARSPQGENHETARLRSALKRLRDLKGGDPEGGHIDADKVLLDLIDDDDIREAFEAISKWYG